MLRRGSLPTLQACGLQVLSCVSHIRTITNRHIYQRYVTNPVLEVAGITHSCRFVCVGGSDSQLYRVLY